MPIPKDLDAYAKQVERLVWRISRILRGQGREVQGAVVCDLASMWIAGHAPEDREAVLQHHLQGIRSLLEINARMVAQRHGLSNWEKH